MKRVSVFKKIFVIAILLVCVGLACVGSFFVLPAHADTEPEDSGQVAYTVSFRINNNLYKTYRLNAGQPLTKPDDTAIADYNWKTSNGQVFDFDASTMPSANLVLNLDIPDVSKFAVVFYKKNPNYDSTKANNNDFYVKYIGIDVKIVDQNATVSAFDITHPDLNTEAGMQCTGWLAGNDTAANTFDFSTPISIHTFMYPKYERVKYTLTFVHWDNTTEEHQVEHGIIFSTTVVGKAQTNKTFGYWYKEGTTAAIDFATATFTADTRLLAYYYDSVLDVTMKGNGFGTFTSTNSFVERGKDFVCTVTLGSDYNQYTLTRDNIRRQGTASSISVNSTPTPGVFTCKVVNVESEITIELQNITKNRYIVSFDLTAANGISIVPDDTRSEYTMSGDNYSVEYGKNFFFTLGLHSDYEAESENINTSAGVGDSATITGYFNDLYQAKVKWSNQYSLYQISTNKVNVDVVVSVPTEECVTVNFTGIENINLSLGTPSFYNSLVKWDESSSIARIKKQSRLVFTAAVINADRYFIAGTTGDGLSTTANQNEYSLYASRATTIAFDVIETVDVYAPAVLTGTSNIAYTPSVNAGGDGYSSITGNYHYKTQRNGSFAIKFTFTTEYSNAVPTVILEPMSAGIVDDSTFAVDKTITITNITDTCTIKYNPLSKNTYTIGLYSNDMAEITTMPGYTTTVYYGDEIKLKITKTTAYSNAAMVAGNIATTSVSYQDKTLEQPEGETYYVVTFTIITNAFTVNVEGLSKNTYKVTARGNDYGTLTTTNEYAQYDGLYVCNYTLGAAYSNAVPRPENVKIENSATGEPIDTFVISIDTSLKQISINKVICEINVYLDALSKNNYTITAAYFASTIGFTSDKKTNVTTSHGSSFSFNLDFNDPSYSQSMDKILDGELNVEYAINSGDFASITPIKTGTSILTFTIYDISGNISFRMDTLSVNRYTIIFYDTDPVKEIIRYNAVAHGAKIVEPTKPTKEGYQCMGWFIGENGTSPFTNFNQGMVSDLELYARYNSQTFTVTFVDYNSSTGRIDRETIKTVSYGKAVTLDTPAVKPGYSRSYWNRDGMDLNSVKQDYRVEAVYEIDVYVVTFYNDTIVYDVQNIEYNEKASRPATDPKKQGYRFVSWSYNFNSLPITQNTDIYAEYEIVSYKIEFRNVTQGNLITDFYQNYDTCVIEPQEFKDENGEVVRGKYIYPYITSTGVINNNTKHQLNSGYVLEGWYADEGLSIRYNFDNPIKGPTVIYGNMYISKVSVKFYVDNDFYIEKLVDYNNTLTEIPSIPQKEGYTQKASIWTIRDLKDVDTNSYNETNISELTNEFRTKIANIQSDIKVYSFYRINTYRVTFKLPDGTALVREVSHGGTVTNIPYPDTTFGEVVVMDNNLLQYVTADTVVYITIIDFLPFLMVAGASCVLAFVIISMVIAIKNMRRGIRNIKNMESLFKAIKKQDARLTQMNEAKLKAQVEEQMKEKDKYKRSNFLDN